MDDMMGVIQEALDEQSEKSSSSPLPQSCGLRCCVWCESNAMAIACRRCAALSGCKRLCGAPDLLSSLSSSSSSSDHDGEAHLLNHDYAQEGCRAAERLARESSLPDGDAAHLAQLVVDLWPHAEHCGRAVPLVAFLVENVHTGDLVTLVEMRFRNTLGRTVRQWPALLFDQTTRPILERLGRADRAWSHLERAFLSYRTAADADADQYAHVYWLLAIECASRPGSDCCTHDALDRVPLPPHVHDALLHSLRAVSAMFSTHTSAKLHPPLEELRFCDAARPSNIFM